jgi:hypothetical protein
VLIAGEASTYPEDEPISPPFNNEDHMNAYLFDNNDAFEPSIFLFIAPSEERARELLAGELEEDDDNAEDNYAMTVLPTDREASVIVAC